MLLESDAPGGAEGMVLLLAEELRRRGHWVCPVGPDHGSGWLAEQFRARGFEPETFSIRRPLDWRCLRGLARLIKQHQIDVIHSHEFAMSVYGAAAALMRRRPHIITMHGGQYFALRWWRRMALRWACRGSANAIAVSRATQSHLLQTLRLDASAIRVIHNGVPFHAGRRDLVRQELGVADGEVLIVAVGSLYPVKGHIILLRALAELEANGGAIPYRLAIVGQGEEESALRTFTIQHGLADRVMLLGYRSDIPAVLAAADIFAMPSLSEGLPLALLEAMFAGKAVVASDVGGIPEVVTPGRDGVLIPAGDHRELSLALRRLIDDPFNRATLGRSAQMRATTDFSVERMTDAYENLYTAAVNGKSSRSFDASDVRRPRIVPRR
jgi:glycosyltransferase involved in cell wall biosynthesis